MFSPESGQTRPKPGPAPSLDSAASSIGFWRFAIRPCLRNEPGFAGARLRCGCLLSGREPFFPPPARPKRRLFCCGFNSGKARQTVRQGRFPGLKFAPDSRAGKQPIRPCPAQPVWPESGPKPIRNQPEPGLNPAASPIGFRRLAHSLLLAKQALPCPDCGAAAASRVFGTCSAPGHEPFFVPAAPRKAAFFRS